MGINPSDFYNMTMSEFWACFNVYSKSQGYKEPLDKDSLFDLMDKYGAPSGSIKNGKA